MYVCNCLDNGVHLNKHALLSVNEPCDSVAAYEVMDCHCGI